MLAPLGPTDLKTIARSSTQKNRLATIYWAIHGSLCLAMFSSVSGPTKCSLSTVPVYSNADCTMGSASSSSASNAKTGTKIVE